jgi:hypothetical protein|tara:strand:+ start:727 stop:870 length:144 start_codon:yes stop_codon:yes gene_type:complete
MSEALLIAGIRIKAVGTVDTQIIRPKAVIVVLKFKLSRHINADTPKT